MLSTTVDCYLKTAVTYENYVLNGPFGVYLFGRRLRARCVISGDVESLRLQFDLGSTLRLKTVSLFIFSRTRLELSMECQDMLTLPIFFSSCSCSHIYSNYQEFLSQFGSSFISISNVIKSQQRKKTRELLTLNKGTQNFAPCLQ